MNMPHKPVESHDGLVRDDETKAIVSKVTEFEKWKRQKRQRNIEETLEDFIKHQKKCNEEICKKIDALNKKIEEYHRKNSK